MGVFSLAGWSRRIRAGFLVSRVTQDTARSRSSFEYRIITFYDVTFQILLLTLQVPRRGPTTPAMRCHKAGLGSSPFARHYWGNHVLFSFPRGTKMFQFPRLASLPTQG